MTHFWSGLVSWMNHGSGFESRRHAEFEKWARTEYKDDWEFALAHMIATNGQKPNPNYVTYKHTPIDSAKEVA